MNAALPESRVDKPLQIFSFIILNQVMFSLMNVMVKLGGEDYSIAQMIFFRNAVAFFPVLYVMSRHGGLKLLQTSNHIGHFWRGTVGVVSMCCFFGSFVLLPLADATAIHFASPLILTILSIPLLGEQVGKYRWGAVIVGLGGVLFMLEPAGNGNFLGVCVALSAAFLGALAMIFVRRLGRTEHALTIVFYFTLYGMVLGGIGMMFMWNPLQGDSFIYLIMMGLLGGVGQIFLTHAYSRAPAAYVASFSYLAMLFAVLFDVMIWHKWPDWHVWTGSLIIMASGLFVLYREVYRHRLNTAKTNVYAQPVIPTEKDERDPLPGDGK